MEGYVLAIVPLRYFGYASTPEHGKELFQVREGETPSLPTTRSQDDSQAPGGPQPPPLYTDFYTKATAAFYRLKHTAEVFCALIVGDEKMRGFRELSPAASEELIRDEREQGALSQSNLTLLHCSDALREDEDPHGSLRDEDLHGSLRGEDLHGLRRDDKHAPMITPASAPPSKEAPPKMPCTPFHTDVGLVSVLPRGRGVPGLHVWDLFHQEWVCIDSCDDLPRCAVVFGGETLETVTGGEYRSCIHEVGLGSLEEGGAPVGGRGGSSMSSRYSAPFQLLARAEAEVVPGKTAGRFVQEVSMKRISSNFPRKV